jgi:4-amino-4-deoxy-L-arabinose transferase-like glycosyltransferase
LRISAMKLSLRQLKLSSRTLILTLGFLQAWAGRFYIDPDGVNYLDVARAYARRDWLHAIDGYWSPLYSWLLAIIEIIFRPSPYWQSTYLHLLNFVFFTLALVAFEFFLSRLQSLANSLSPELSDESARPRWAWWLLGYTAFAVCTLRIITLSNDTPDMALAMLVFLATGCLIDLRRFERSWLRYALLGAILGFAYLTKGVMFPLFFVFLFSVAFARGGLKKPDLRALATLAGFLLVSMPFVAALSHFKGHFTFGETGKVAYIHQVTGVDEHNVESMQRLTREAPKHNQAQHSPQKISDNPTAYIYVTPFTFATYPAWYDSGYWWSARTPIFSLRDQARAIGRSAVSFFHIFSTEKQWIAGWLVLALLASAWRRLWARLKQLWFIWLPPIATLALYSLVLVEPRYTAVWITIILLSLFAAVDWPQLESARSTGAAVILAIAVTSGVAVLKGGVDSVADCLRKQPHVQFEIGQSLLGMGLKPGDQVAFIGHTIVPYYWAHLSGLRVTGDVQAEDLYSYWTAPQQKRNEIAERFQANGIKALVMSGPPLVQDGWRPIDGTGYYVQFIASESSGNAESSASPSTSDTSSR